MKVCLITGYTPWPENRNGISGLVYYLIKNHSEDINIDIFSFNINRITQKDVDYIAKDLNVNIFIIPICLRNYFVLGDSILKKVLSWLYIYPLDSLLKVPKWIRSKIAKKDYDIVWLYPNFFYKLAYEFPNQKFVISGPDCESLNATRRMADPYYINRKIKNIHNFIYLNQVFKREEKLIKPNILVHLVGMTDFRFFCKLHNMQNAFFILHPHYTVMPKNISFSVKLKVLIAGRYDHYMNTDSQIMLNSLIKSSHLLKDRITITYLGKGWFESVEKLRSNGYDCQQLIWVSDYSQELIKYDVQIAPISNGAGTKGKVLCGLSNGLLTIASKVAAENICIRDKDSILIYKDPSDIPSILLSICNNINKYEKIAEKGRMQVLKYHNPSRISRRFMDIITNSANWTLIK